MQQTPADIQPLIAGNRRAHASTGRRRRRAQRCGICQGCLREDCGQCRNCKDKVKFGGPGTKKQRCMLRTCTNMVSFSKQKSPRNSVEEKDLTSVKITCVFCGRKRKKGLSRSAFFCTKHCQTRWQDSHPGELPSQVPHISDDEDSMTAYILEATFSNDQFCEDKTTTTYTSCSNKMEGETVLPLKTTEGTGPEENMSSNIHPVTLSPSPTPLSSPALYSPPASHLSGNELKMNKWKEIIRKLSLHNELRSVWNELKVRGDFSTNEDFIIHLLRCEAERQCIQYDILTDKTPMDDADVTKYPVDTSADLASSVSEVTENVTSEHCATDVDSNLLQMDATCAEENAQEHTALYQQLDCSSKQCELTVLDCQGKCGKDDADFELCVDDVIDYL